MRTCKPTRLQKQIYPVAMRRRTLRTCKPTRLQQQKMPHCLMQTCQSRCQSRKNKNRKKWPHKTLVKPVSASTRAAPSRKPKKQPQLKVQPLVTPAAESTKPLASEVAAPTPAPPDPLAQQPAPAALGLLDAANKQASVQARLSQAPSNHVRSARMAFGRTFPEGRDPRSASAVSQRTTRIEKSHKMWLIK